MATMQETRRYSTNSINPNMRLGSHKRTAPNTSRRVATTAENRELLRVATLLGQAAHTPNSITFDYNVTETYRICKIIMKRRERR